MAFGVDAFGLRRGAKQARDVGKSVQFGTFGKCPIFLVRLALAGKGNVQVFGSAHTKKSIGGDKQSR